MDFNREEKITFEKAALTLATIESTEIHEALIKIIDLRHNVLYF